MAKCRFCKKEIDKSTAYSSSKGMYYCDESCYEQAQDKKKPQKNYIPQKDSARRALTDYILELYLQAGYNKNKINWAIIGSQISNLLKENPTWKYSGIKYTLWYMVEIKEMNLFDNYDGSILNLVPFYFNEARDYYMECEDIKRAIEEFEFDEEVKVIKRGDSKRKVKEVEF